MGNSGSFKKGWKGGGRKPIPPDVREAARAACPRAIERLKEMIESKDERVAVMAANAILDRAYGKAAQPLTGAGGESDIGVAITVSFVSAKQ
jgi:hypothetical protein